MSDKEIAIPDWSAGDYRSGTAPFDWLYQHRENKFLMAQLCDQIKVKAGAVGVKNFITLWKAYLEMVNSRNNVITDNATAFDGQPVELYCGEYTCDDFGVTYLDRYGADVIVCRHPIMPIRRLSNVDTGEIKLEMAFKRGNRWKTLIADKSALASSQKILDLARFGVAVDSESSKDLVRFITYIEDDNYDKLGETRSVGRLGWISDYGFSPYVDGLCFDGDLVFSHMFDAVQESGSYAAWLDLVREVRKSSLVARIQLAASFASVLVEPLGCLPFFVHVWGGTEAGKTVGLMLAASVWANPAPGEYIKTFNSTNVGLEMLAGFVNSLPLCLDELQIIKDKKGFDKDIYMLTEGIGRNRGAKAGGLQKIQTWKNCILTTGEQPINNSNSGGGAVNRVIEIDCKDEKLFEDPRHVANTVRKHYGFAGKLFVSLVSDNGEKIHSTYEKFYDVLSGGISTEKQSMAAAIILTADELTNEWIFQDGQTLGISDIEQFLTSKSDVDFNQRALEWVYEFVATNTVRFKSSENPGEIWGEIDEDRIYVIKSVFDSKTQEAGFNSASFLSWAKRRGILRTDPGRNTTRKRICGTDLNTHCVCILQSELQQVVDYDELPL